MRRERTMTHYVYIVSTTDSQFVTKEKTLNLKKKERKKIKANKYKDKHNPSKKIH